MHGGQTWFLVVAGGVGCVRTARPMFSGLSPADENNLMESLLVRRRARSSDNNCFFLTQHTNSTHRRNRTLADFTQLHVMMSICFSLSIG